MKKNILMYLVSLSLCFGLVSCKSELVITGPATDPITDPINDPIAELPSDSSEVSSAKALARDLRALRNLLAKTSEGKFIFAIAGFSDVSNESDRSFTVATYLRSERFDFEKMQDWVEDVLDKIDTLNTPIVNERIREIEDLRDAESNAELRSRYTNIINRMESEQRTARVRVGPLKEAVTHAIRNLQSTQGWIESEFARNLLFEEELDMAYLAEAALTRLDFELDKIDD